MNRLHCIPILFVIGTLSYSAKGQDDAKLQSQRSADSSRAFQPYPIVENFNKQSRPRVVTIDSLKSTILESSDTSFQNKVLSVGRALQNPLDSLNRKSESHVRRRLDSLTRKLNLNTVKQSEHLINERIDHVQNDLPSLETFSSEENSAAERIDSLQAIGPELGIGPLGKDVGRVNSVLQEVNPGLEMHSVGSSQAIDVNMPKVKVPGSDSVNSSIQLSDEATDVQNQIEKINDVTQQASDVTQNDGQYTKEIKTLKEQSLTQTEKLPELAEQQAAKLEEVKALKAEEAASTKQLAEYQKLIEQYKEEKRIHEELREKTKELATEKIAEHQGKVNEVMAKVGKYKRKFSQVHDMRNLPKRAPNPMKDLSWRERVVPGLTFQIFSSNATWLEFDPQVYYKLNGNLSAGVGGMYRFSMNPGKLTFDDFGSMTGVKIFGQFHIMKGFFVRGEGQYVRWKPWDFKLTDPNYVDHTFVGAAGIGKSYQIAKKLKGNIQTLYHFHWEGMDPYKPKVMIRLGFDFSLKKREERHWEKKLKEREQEMKK